ncbi:F-box protein [Aspergillus lucknowensis]|uniref:F-box domain-containing protein n=1 Tax=Aspergillus lucknowensis TaxID=176173 RepID=A0ABR4LE25_9EURO
MASRLPPELLTQIALYLELDSSSLAKCARVCQQWQPMFKQRIYHTLRMAISLSTLDSLISGPNQHRRSYIRYLQYTATMSYNIRDYQAVKLEGYNQHNLIRAANNKAFRRAISSLIETNKDTDRWQGVMDREHVVPLYRACLPDRTSTLPQVSCIDGLLYKPRGYNIAWVRLDYLEFICKRRQVFAARLARLPSSLREFHYQYKFEHTWSNILHALDLRPSNSKQSNHFCIIPYWPYLERIDLDTVLDYLPSGEWFFNYELSPEDAEDIPDPATGNQIFESRWLLEEDLVGRDKPKPEYFHRLFILLGYAARRMPCLKWINVFPVEWPRTELQFRGGSTAPEQHLIFQSNCEYMLDQQVANAWGFLLDTMDVEDTWPGEDYYLVVCKVTLDQSISDK